MPFDSLGNVTAYICVPLTILANCWLVLPLLTSWSRAYFIFLMSWTLPYVIGNICDTNKIGPQWVQWHLLDVSYEPWVITLGVTIYAVVMKLARRAITQRSILVCSGISLAVFVVMAYGWELMQSWLAWQRFGQTIDWSDYAYYAIGTAISVSPFLVLARLRPIMSARPS